MLNRHLIIAVAGAMAFSIGLSDAAIAQSAGPTSNPEFGGRPAPGSSVDPNPVASTRDTNASRVRGRRAQAEAAKVDPAAIKAEVEAVFASSSTTCTVTEAKLLGVSAEQQKIYEASCAAAPGYIVVASTPPQIVDCIVLDSQAQTARAADPAAPTGPTCTLPANQDIQGFLKAYATQAGVPCTVDEARVRGQASNGAIVYEIGCVGVDGYWIEKTAAGWDKTECLQVVSQNSTCVFTTPAEQAATVKSWLADTGAAACDVQQVRLMGQNANGRFIEMTCAGADGFIIRQNAEHAVQQVYPCATAQQIGGGCKLTTTPPAATPQA
jgi:hypothetical protein